MAEYESIDDQAKGMARDKALGKPEESFRHLWQVPAFLAGLAALTGALLSRPASRQDAVPTLERELATIRKTLASPNPNLPAALAAANDLLQKAGPAFDKAAEVHFCLGQIYVSLAERSPSDKAKDVWSKALASLQQAEALHVPDEDASRLAYLLGKAFFHLGAEPQKVIDYLARSVEHGTDNPSEGFELLTQAYLRLPTPDIMAALDANQQQLARSTEDDSHLIPVRLLRAELLLRADANEDARTVLRRIEASASPKLFARARFLLAKSCQEDKRWAEAAILWEELLHNTATPDPTLAVYLGVCYRELGRLPEAERAWAIALRSGGEMGQAAALGLAEAKLAGKAPGLALEYLRKATNNLKEPGDFHNSFVSATELENIFVSANRRLVQNSHFVEAWEVASLYGRLSSPVQVQRMMAETADAWGTYTMVQSANATAADKDRWRQEASVHWREAGIAYHALAVLNKGQPEELNWLWTSADRHSRAHNDLQAIVVLKQYVEVETAPPRLGEAWLKIAEAYEKIKDGTSARSAYYKCIEYTSQFAFRARYQLALADIARGKTDDAEAALKQNLDLMRGAVDDDAYEKSLLALAKLLVARKSYRQAALRLQEALERYPAHAETLANRFLLAECYQRLAALEDQNLRTGSYLTPEAQLHYQDQRRLWLQKAAAHFQKLTDDLASHESAGTLTENDERTFRQAGFALGECRFELGEYLGAVPLYEELALRYRHQVFALDALQQITRCYWVRYDQTKTTEKDREKAQESIKRFQEQLTSLPDTAFTTTKPRRLYEDWLAWALRQ